MSDPTLIGRLVRPLSSPDISRRITRLLTDEDSYTSVLTAFVLDMFGPDCLEWHPTTIRLELEKEFQIGEIPSLTIDKIAAGLTIITTDVFYTDVRSFIRLANVLSGSPFDPDEFDPADVSECVWGIAEAVLIDPPDGQVVSGFTSDIKKYLQVVLREEGWLYPPVVLRDVLGPGTDEPARRVAALVHRDPDLYTQIVGEQQRRHARMEQSVRDQLVELARQIQETPFRYGRPEPFLTSIAQWMQRWGLITTNLENQGDNSHA